MSELNRQKRLEVRIKVNLKYPDRRTFVERFSQNLSRTGIFIRASDPAPVGSRVHFEYTIGDNTRVLRGVGIVRWARKPADAQDPDKPPGMGLEFIDVDPQTEAFIAQIVKEHGEGSRAPQRRPTRTLPPVTGGAATTSAPASPKPRAQLDHEEQTALNALIEGQPKPTPKPDARTPTPAAQPAAPRAPVTPAATDLGREPDVPAASAPPPVAGPDADEALDLDAIAAAAAPPHAPAPGLDLSFAAPAATPPPAPDVLAFDLGVETPADVDSSVLVEIDAEPRAPELTAPVPQAMKQEPTPPPEDPFAGAEAAVTTPPAPAPTPAPKAAPAVQLTKAVIDLCSKELLVCTWDAAGEVSTRRVAARLALEGTAVRLSPTGVPVTGLVGWVGRRWPSAQTSAAARRLGISLCRGPGGEPALMLGTTPVSLLDALGACVRDLVEPLEDAPPPCVTLIVPARVHMTVTSILKATLNAVGVNEVRTMTDAVLALRASGSVLVSGHWALVIDVGLAETRATLMQSPETAAGLRTAVDCSLHDVDQLLTERAAMQLLRVAGVDIADDASLQTSLEAQVSESRRSSGAGPPWSLSVAGSELTVEPSTVAQWAEPLSERVALLADALLNEYGVPAQALKAIVVTAEEQPWPGLLATLESALGVRPIVPEGGPVSRIRLAGKD
jgi:uncharacterized protein (TIGR02266 family)